MSERPSRAAEVKLGFYKHFKGGEYKVLGVARDSETLEEVVIYLGKSGMWARPIDSFLGEVDQPAGDGKSMRVPRFKYEGPVH